MNGGSPDSTRVVELRIHGVSGTPVEAMLGDTGPRQVAGDDTGRFFRRAGSRVPGGDDGGHRAVGERVVEAYHWGRYTAGSVTRALWLTLLPFALLNIARFALLVSPERRRTRDRFADLVLRLLGLALTVGFVVTACYVGWEVAARQCGGTTCIDHGWWLSWFTGRSYGVRVAIAALLPAAAIALVWTFGRQTFTYDPPGPQLPWMRGSNGSFADPGFWRGSVQSSRQRAAHVWAGCGVLAGLALGTLGSPSRWWQDAPITARTVYVLLAAAAAAGVLTAVTVVVWNPLPPDGTPLVSDPRDGLRIPFWMRALRWGSLIAAAACVWLAQVGLDGFGHPRPGSSTVLRLAVNGTTTAMAALLLLVLVACAVTAFDPRVGRGLRRGFRDSADYPPVPRAFRPFLAGFGAWLIAVLAVTVASGYATAFVFWTARALGRPVMEPFAATVTRTDTRGITLAAGYWAGALVWAGLAVCVLLLALPLAAWLLRRRPLRVIALVALATALTIWASLTHQGGNLLSDQAEYYLGAAVLVAGAAGLCLIPPPSAGLATLVADDYREPGQQRLSGKRRFTENEDTPAQLRRGRLTVARAWLIALGRYRYHHALAVIGVCLGLAVLTTAAATWMPGSRLGPLADGTLGAIGVSVAAAHAAAMIALGLNLVRKPGLLTTAGVTWDLLSFWPRVAHPLSPPPYGGRAVLAVARRCADLVTDPEHGGCGPADAVVLSGHSQGSTIAVAAVTLLDGQARAHESSDPPAHPWMPADRARAALDRLRLLTYGSQLQFIYARLFPAYLGYAQLRKTYHALNGRWRNLYRWTDPLGGPVLSFPHHDPEQARYGPAVRRWTFLHCDLPTCGGHEARPEPADTPDGDAVTHRFWAIGPDIRLRDPAVIAECAQQPRLRARGHGGYPADPAFDEVLAALVGVPGGTGIPRCPQPAGVDTVVGNSRMRTEQGSAVAPAERGESS